MSKIYPWTTTISQQDFEKTMDALDWKLVPPPVWTIRWMLPPRIEKKESSDAYGLELNQ